MKDLDLCGPWEVLFDFSEKHDSPRNLPAHDGWQTIQVPGCWEQVSLDKVSDGPVWYRKRFELPLYWTGSPTELDCHGINYFSEVWLNGHRVGEHTGGWAGFRLSVSNGLLRVGESNELIIKVYKQGTKFPLRESLAGFLPDVNFIFGGIWKGLWFRQAASVEVGDVFVKPRLDANCANVEYKLAAFGEKSLQVTVLCLVTDMDGRLVAQSEDVRIVQGKVNETFETVVPFTEQADWWTPENPVLYQLTLRCLVDGAVMHEHHSRFGMREVTASGSQLLLNKSPLYLRGALHWGWYRELGAPIVSREQIRHELQQIKDNGFNLVKLCLFVPTADYFDLADEVGVLLWQELPLWQPAVSHHFRETVLEQYTGIILEVRNHPSLILWTLGCELDQVVDAKLLQELYDLTKQLTDNAFVRDNSGSGECYGGQLTEHADFYDYHFYTDVHFFPDLMAQFAGPWRPIKPWLFGEFCDYDTYRDIARLRAENGGGLPWWLQDDAALNPASGKKMVSYSQQECKMERHHLPFSDEELRQNSVQSAYVYRKMILEMIRTYPQVAGYVITSIWDTPISTSAIFDDFNEPKHDKLDFQKINQDTVIALTWDHRRDWVHGGDRIVHWDHYNYFSGDVIRPHIFISHFGREPLMHGTLRWQVSTQSGHELLEAGSMPLSMESGEAREVTVVEFEAPGVSTEPCKLHMTVSVDVGEEVRTNHWEFWVLPRINSLDMALYDPQGTFAGLEAHVSGVRRIQEFTDIAAGSIVVATSLNDALNQYIQAGGQVFYVQRGDGPFPTAQLPFWRESVQLYYPHPIMTSFPHENHTGTLLYSLATDAAFVTDDLPDCTPILGRLDARRFDLHQYLIELQMGKGRLVATTLRLEGGLGNQPSGIRYSPVGLLLLDTIIRYLQGMR